MKRLIILICFSLAFSQELKVEGNLNVTGAVINDSLAQVIATQQAEIDSLQTQITSQQTLIEQLQAQILPHPQLFQHHPMTTKVRFQ